MIKIDENYTDFRDDSDPNYPGGKAVDAPTPESIEGTPFFARWMNCVNGFRQAVFLRAFGSIDKVSNRPDNAAESDTLKAIEKIINEKAQMDNVHQAVTGVRPPATDAEQVQLTRANGGAALNLPNAIGGENDVRRAGMMSAADKTRLDNVHQGVTGVRNPTANAERVQLTRANGGGVLNLPQAVGGTEAASREGMMSAADKRKLDGIDNGAQANPGNATPTAAGLMSATDKTRLDNVHQGVTGVRNPTTNAEQVQLTRANGGGALNLPNAIGGADSARRTGMMSGQDKQRLDSLHVNAITDVNTVLNILYPVGDLYVQYPDTLPPLEKGLPGTRWDEWSERAVIYELTTVANYNAINNGSNPPAWTGSSGQSVAAGTWRVWNPVATNRGDRRIIRANRQTTQGPAPAMNPIEWDDVSGIVRIPRRRLQAAWTAADLAIGAAVNHPDTGAAMRVVGVLTLGGKFLSVEGANRPTFESGGVGLDAIRDIIGSAGQALANNAPLASSALFLSAAGSSISGGQWATQDISFDASRAVPIANENSPRTLSVRYWRRVS